MSGLAGLGVTITCELCFVHANLCVPNSVFKRHRNTFPYSAFILSFFSLLFFLFHSYFPPQILVQHFVPIAKIVLISRIPYDYGIIELKI